MQEIRNINLSDLIQNHGIELKKVGSRYVARCPFHNEKTGSFFVYPDNNFHCFGCGVSGDAATFIMKIFSCSFPEALQRLGIREAGKHYSKKESQLFEENRAKRRLVESFRAWESRYSSKLGVLILSGHKALSKVKNSADLSKLEWLFSHLNQWEHRLDILCYGSDKDKYDLFMEVN